MNKKSNEVELAYAIQLYVIVHNPLNVQVMEATARKVVNRIQEEYQCKVVRLSLEYVEDINGKIWLVNSTECLHAIEKVSLKRSVL